MDGISRFADGVQKFVWKNTSENCWTGWRCVHSHTGLDRIKELQGYVHERTKCGSKLFRGVLIWSDHGICTLDFLGKVCGDLLWGREDMVNKSKEIIMGMVGWYWSKLDMLVNWICEASKDSTVLHRFVARSLGLLLAAVWYLLWWMQLDVESSGG